MMRSTRLQPKIQELQRRHEGNQQKLNAELQKLYQEEGVNPMSGCLWSLLPLFLLIPLYSIIRQPITRMMMAPATVVDELSTEQRRREAAAETISVCPKIPAAAPMPEIPVPLK